MSMTPSESSEVLAKLEVETEIERVDTAAVAILNRSEVEAQLDAAHRYPRNLHKFVTDAMAMATLTKAIAESCIYALPRGGKVISGPSVRLAEICASAYGNIHIGSRVLDADDTTVIAQGIAWDLEKNVRVSIEARRRITDRGGKRFNDDMITVTGAAAGSIALRNAVFRVVPRSYVDAVYARAREVAVGNASTLAQRRGEVVQRLQKIGVPVERIFARIGKAAIEDVGLDELEILIGLGTTIKNNERSIDEAFPEIDATPAKAKDLEAEMKEKAKKRSARQEAPARDFDAEATALKEAIADAKSEEEKTAVLLRAKKFATEDKARGEDVLRFFSVCHEGLKVEREPGEEG